MSGQVEDTCLSLDAGHVVLHIRSVSLLADHGNGYPLAGALVAPNKNGLERARSQRLVQAVDVAEIAVISG